MNDSRSEEAGEASATLVTVKVALLGEIRSLAGRRKTEIALLKGSTLQDLLSRLCGELGVGFAKRLFRDDSTLHNYVKVFVDGTDIQTLDGLETRLDGGRVDVLILPMYTGG